MAGYRVVIKPSAVKELEDIPAKERRRIAERIRELSDSPRPVACVKLSGEGRYRVRQGDYRVIYEVIDRGQLVRVVKVGHRREVYR